MIGKYDEVAWANYLINNGFINNNKRKDLKVLSKYYYSLGFSQVEVKDKLLEFCYKYFIDFNKVIHSNLIKDMVKFGEKNKIINIPYVRVYINEINYINSLGLSLRACKLLFTLLVLNKIYRDIYNTNYINDKLSYIQKVSNTSYNVILYDNIKELESIKAIQLTIMSNIKFELNMDNVELSGDYIDIIDLDNIGFYYQNYMGIKKYIACQNCSTMMLKKNNKHKYCKVCAKMIDNKQNTERRREKRSKLLEKNDTVGNTQNI